MLDGWSKDRNHQLNSWGRRLQIYSVYDCWSSERTERNQISLWIKAAMKTFIGSLRFEGEESYKAGSRPSSRKGVAAMLYSYSTGRWAKPRSVNSRAHFFEWALPTFSNCRQIATEAFCAVHEIWWHLEIIYLLHIQMRPWIHTSWGPNHPEDVVIKRRIGDRSSEVQTPTSSNFFLNPIPCINASGAVRTWFGSIGKHLNMSECRSSPK